MLLPTGSRIILPRQSRSATEVYVTGADIDWGAEALLARFADPRRDFLDVGAHIGYYSSYLSPLVRRAYAFEPDPRNLPGLRANAAIAGNVEVIDVAVSAQAGRGRLNLAGGSAVSHLQGASETGDAVEVQVTSVDHFVAARPDVRVGLVKTDVEGHDLEVLRGMEETVSRDQPLILTECSDGDGLAELRRRWEYEIFSYLRGRRSLKTSFKQMTLGDLQHGWYKMLFLVPRGLHEAFARIAEAGG